MASDEPGPSARTTSSARSGAAAWAWSTWRSTVAWAAAATKAKRDFLGAYNKLRAARGKTPVGDDF